MHTLFRTVVGVAFLCFSMDSAHAQEAPARKMDRVLDELEALRAEVADLRQRVPANWMDAARQAELRTLVERVVADADSRRAFQGAGPGAGYEGGSFFLEDEGFRMNLSGQIQFRYVLNSDGGSAGASDDADGFELRRAKVQLKGYLEDPKITYVLRFASSRSTADTTLEEGTIGYKFDNGIEIVAGNKKLPFLRQELLSSSRQLAVDRGIGTEFFTTNFAEQIQVLVPIHERAKLYFAYSDGGDSDSTAALADTVSYAFTGRLETVLLGEFDDGRDLRPRGDEGHAVLIGFAVHAEEDEITDAETVAWTADTLFKTGPLTGMAAYMGGRDDGIDVRVHGLTGEIGYALTAKLQPYFRYDAVWEEGEGEINAVTAGVNYYLGGHSAKLTTDVVWVFDGDDINPIGGLNSAPTNAGIGLIGSGASEQIAYRAQFQLLF